MPQAVIAVGAKVLVAAGLKTTVALAVSSFVVTQTAISVASFAASKVLGRRSGGSATLQERQASVINIQLGEAPREAVFGTTTTGGSLVDAFSYGGQYGTDTFAQCIALADHEISRIVGYYVDDTYVPWSGNGVQPGFNGKLSLLFQNATEAGHAPPSVALANGWSASDVGRGVARIWAFVTYDEQVWSQGFPRFRWVLEGAKVYDPRRDADLGYSGANPCDFDDPATWVVSQNPILLDYAYRRGIYVAGRHQQSGQLLVGRGLSALEAPPAAIIAAANVCDEVMSPGALRYRAAGVIRADQPFVEVAEMFAAACAGVIVQREGGVEIEPGQAKAAVVTITDDDLVVGEAVSFSSFLPDTEGGRVNTVVPRYVSPDQGWKDHAGPVRRSQDDITADGGPREATLALALVTDADQADRSAEISRRLYRLERRATIVLPPRFAYLEEGDWIAWTSARHGGATVRYRIESWSMGEDWRMRLTLREIAASVFGEADPIADQAIPAPPPVPADALELDEVTVEAITLAGETSTLPAVRFRWETPVDPAILAIRAEIRVAGETEISTARTEAVGEGVLVVTNGVAPGQSLQGRLVPIGHPSRPVVPSSWVTISTAEIGAAVDPGQLEDLNLRAAALIAADIADAMRSYNDTVRRKEEVRAESEARQTAINLVETTVEEVATDLQAEIVTRTDQISALNGQVASVSSATTTNATNIAAVASRTTVLEAEIQTPTTGLLARATSLEFRTTAVETGKASAASVDALTSTVGSLSATVTTVSSTVADLEANQAIAAWQVLAEASGGSPASIGLVSTNAGPSGVLLRADYIGFGQNTLFDDATDTLQTTVGGYRRVLALGAPFGASSNLVEWWGEDDIALSAMTTANGLNGRMTSAPYVFDNVVSTALSASASAYIVGGGRTGAGAVTTGTTTVTVSTGESGATIRWFKVSGDDLTVNSPTSFTTSFSGSVGVGQSKTALFQGVVTKGGAQASVFVQADIIDNGT